MYFTLFFGLQVVFRFFFIENFYMLVVLGQSKHQLKQISSIARSLVERFENLP